MSQNDQQSLLAVEELTTYFYTRRSIIKAVDGIDLRMAPGETLGLVGESGSGKSVTALSILRLVPPPGRIIAGKVYFEGQDLLQLSEAAMRKIRGRRIAIIFQDPTASLNPIMTVGQQIMEKLQLHEALNRMAAREAAIGLMHRVGIPAPATRVDDYPHQFSGGMRQRVMIAIALACDPALLLADEPTTALDMTIQAQILDLLRQLQEEMGSGVLLITHDLAVIAEMCQRVTVMYAGKVMEWAATRELLSDPKHPYTQGLIQALPRLGRRKERLMVIPGTVASPSNPPPGCPFHPRCLVREEICDREMPRPIFLNQQHLVACHKYDGGESCP